MNISKKILNVLIIALVSAPVVFGGLLVSADAFDPSSFATQEDFEDNMFSPGFDMYINWTASSPLSLKGWTTQEISQNWKITRTVLIPESVSKNWEVLDKQAVISTGEYRIDKADYNDPGYFAFSDAVTNLIFEFDQMDLADGGATNIDVGSYYLSQATVPTSTNITSFDSDPVSGIEYIATDGKTIDEYAADEALKLGGTLNDIANCTALGFSYEGLYDELVSVNFNFDDESLTSVRSADTPEGDQKLDGIITRVRTWLHNRKVRRSNLGLTGTQYTIQDSIFKDIRLAGGSLPGIPTGAKYFFSKLIGAGFFSKTFSVGALGSGILTSATGKLIAFISGIFFLLVGTFVVIYLVKRYRNRKR